MVKHGMSHAMIWSKVETTRNARIPRACGCGADDDTADTGSAIQLSRKRRPSNASSAERSVDSAI